MKKNNITKKYEEYTVTLVTKLKENNLDVEYFNVTVKLLIDYDNKTFTIENPCNNKKDFGFINRNTNNIPKNIAVCKCVEKAIKLAGKLLSKNAKA